MTNTISAEALRAALLDDEELALVDVREVGAFSRAHLLWANCIPFSRLELRVDALIPRRSTRIVLCDADESQAGATQARTSVMRMSKSGGRHQRLDCRRHGAVQRCQRAE